MKASKLTIIAFASLAIFMYSCGNNNSAKDEHGHHQNDGHNHSEITQESTSNRNDKGELTDASGNIITGCPMHKEMIGSEGDLCPKCNYMKMPPITWDIAGIDTIRVTSLPDYNPPTE